MSIFIGRDPSPPLVARPKPAAKLKPIVWAAWACLALGVSGLVRSWQDSRLVDAAQLSEAAPFPLKELPLNIEGWTYRTDVDESLDPRIANIVGSNDHLIRTYEDEATGVSLTLLVIYGNGQALSGHVPEVCYPSVGYAAKEPGLTLGIKAGEGPRFRALVFNKSGGAEDDRQEVYYSFLHEGIWNPDAMVNWKEYRHNPAMFKIQVARRMAPQERRVVDNPTTQFLNKFIPIFEDQLAGRKPTEPTRTQIVEPSKAGTVNPEGLAK